MILFCIKSIASKGRPEGFQRAIGKPFGRARRRETSALGKAIVLSENSLTRSAFSLSPLARRRTLETFGAVLLLLCFYCRTGLVSFATAATHRGGIATEQSIMAGKNFTADASALQAILPALQHPAPAGRLRPALADIPPHRAAPSRPGAYRKLGLPEKDNSRR